MLSELWQATYFSTKNPIIKLAITEDSLLLAAEFHFVNPVVSKTLSASAVKVNKFQDAA